MGSRNERRGWRHLYPRKTTIVRRRVLRWNGARFEVTILRRHRRTIVEIWRHAEARVWERLYRGPVPQELDPDDRHFARRVLDKLAT